mmetsp:Transcript_30549/g.63885  ORF Transcript_30549/g.63885 Transcript_30549/m.63885 type:complete len:139 (+) Transcript_30549:3007-3423(+)
MNLCQNVPLKASGLGLSYIMTLMTLCLSHVPSLICSKSLPLSVCVVSEACGRYVGVDMFGPVDSGLIPSVSNNNNSALANAIRQNGAKAYVGMSVSMPITKTEFLARTTDFIVSFYKHEPVASMYTHWHIYSSSEQSC